MALHHAKTRKSPLAALANVWALFNLLLFIVTLAMASHIADGYFDGKSSVTRLLTRPATLALIFFSLLASAVGVATNIFSFLHLAYWSEAARLSNLAVNMVTLALNWLAAGFGIRALREDVLDGSGRYARESKALAALHIIAMLSTLLHVISLGLFHHNDKHVATTQPTVTNAGYDSTGALPHHHKLPPGQQTAPHHGNVGMA